MIVVAAPLTTHRPCGRTTSTSFEASVSSVSLKFGLSGKFARIPWLSSSTAFSVFFSRAKAPSVACGN